MLFSSQCKRYFMYDLAVVGGGPGGYCAALKAAQLGMKVACVEKRKTMGGTCLNVGCIPSKALLNISHIYQERTVLSKLGLVGGMSETGDLSKMHKAKDEVVSQLCRGIEGLLKKNKVERLVGHARLIGPNQLSVKCENGAKDVDARNIIIATGSETSTLPGFTIDEEFILSSTGILSLKKVPKKLIIIGGGVIGLELGSVYSRFGSQVQVLEFLDRITPTLDVSVASALQKMMESKGFKFHLNSRATAVRVDKAARKVQIDFCPANSKDSKASSTLEADCVLVCVGRRPNTNDLGLEEMGIELDKLRRIVVKDKICFETPKYSNIHAVGDVIEGPMLAHKAEEEGVAAALACAGTPIEHPINYENIPSVVYTHPEVAAVGPTEEYLKKINRPHKVAVFPMIANARAKIHAMGSNPVGFVKLLYCAQSLKLLGGSIVADSAGEMIHELALILNAGIPLSAIADHVSHAHPTLSESIKEASLIAVHGKALHI